MGGRWLGFGSETSQLVSSFPLNCPFIARTRVPTATRVPNSADSSYTNKHIQDGCQFNRNFPKEIKKPGQIRNHHRENPNPGDCLPKTGIFAPGDKKRTSGKAAEIVFVSSGICLCVWVGEYVSSNWAMEHRLRRPCGSHNEYFLDLRHWHWSNTRNDKLGMLL